MRAFQNFDIFRKITAPQQLQQTSTGAFITILAASIMFTLIITQTYDFIYPAITRQTLIDQDKGSQKLPINLSITFPGAPCLLLGLDQVDSVGNHIVSVGGYLKKTPLSKQGIDLPIEQRKVSKETGIQAINAGQGCRLEGLILIQKVPGNFHISFHEHNHLMQQMPRTTVSKIRMDHTIHHLSFGSQTQHTFLTKTFGTGQQTNFSPLEGTSKKDLKATSRHQYYMKIVPTVYLDQNSQTEFTSYHFSSNSLTFHTHGLFGSAWFRYDIENITMKYTKPKRSIATYLVSQCAIIGGIIAVLGIINSLIQEALRK